MTRTIPFALILLIACSPQKKKSEEKTEVGPNGEQIVRSAYPDGKIKSEVLFKDGKKNGVARTFDKDGSLILELPYVDNNREGTSKKYYAGGTVLAQTTEYKNDKMNGLQTKYRGNGNVLSEARYENDFACADLKEYLENKSLKKKYPTIKVKVVNEVATKGIYTLKISMSERVRSVKYYKGKLSKSGCLYDGLEYLLMDEATKTGEISYYLPPGSFVMEEVNIIAAFETIMDNTAIAQLKYNVAVDN